MLIFLMLLTQLGLAAPGFFPLLDLRPAYGEQISALKGLEGCASFRIHKTKSIYLTALHCFSKELESSEFVQLGSPLEPEPLFYFNNSQVDKLVKNGSFKVLAHGSCFTGLGLDVLYDESSPNRQRALDCAQGDWLIFESINPSPDKCLKVAVGLANEEIFALGHPRKETLDRPTGLSVVQGEVYSKGILYTSSRLSGNYFPFSALTGAFTVDGHFQRQFDQNLFVSSADVITGMSGGPVVNKHFKAIGLSTLKLSPNMLWRYSEYDSFLDYMESSHGVLKISSIMEQLDSLSGKYFDCH